MCSLTHGTLVCPFPETYYILVENDIAQALSSYPVEPSYKALYQIF